MPYLAVYMKMTGLSPSETALTCGVVYIVNAFSQTFIGGLADKFNAHKKVMMLLCLLSATFHGCMLFVPQRLAPETNHWSKDVQLHCGTNGAHVFACISSSAYIQQVEVTSNVSSNMEGNSYADNVERYLSFNAPACKWTCPVGHQNDDGQQAEQVCFGRSLHKKCITLHDATTFAFRVNTLQRKHPENCRATESRNTDEQSCHCYAMFSVVIDSDTFKQMVCQNQTALTCTIDHCGIIGGYVARNTSRQEIATDRKGYHFGWIFWGIAIFYLLGQMTLQPVFGLTDAMTYTVLGEDLHKWGRQRLWGTIGCAVFGLLSGVMMDAYGHGKNEYTAAFLLFALCMILASISACQYTLRDVAVARSSQVFRDVLGLVKRPDAFVLFCVVLIFGMYQGLIYTFLFWYLKLLGDVPQVLLGLCLVHGCVPETIMLFFSGKIIRKIGHVFSMSLVFVAFAVRLGSYSFLSNPWMVLCIEPLHAITFGLMYANASTYASRITPPGTHGSVQSIIGSLFFSFGELFCHSEESGECAYLVIAKLNVTLVYVFLDGVYERLRAFSCNIPP